MTLDHPKHDASMIRRICAVMAATFFGFSSSLVLAAVPANITLETAKPSELSAIQVRVLQSEMMVAALTCDLRPQYNEIVILFKDELGRHGANLRSYFERSYGRAGGEKQLNSFVTEMANRASSHAVSQGSFYCAGAKNLLTDILSLPGRGLKLADASRQSVDMTSFQVITPGPGVQVASAAPKPGVVIAGAHPSLAKAIERADVAATKAAKDAQKAAELADATAKAELEAAELAALNTEPNILLTLSGQSKDKNAIPSLAALPPKPVDQAELAIAHLSDLPTPVAEHALTQIALAMKAEQEAVSIPRAQATLAQESIAAVIILGGAFLYLLIVSPGLRRRVFSFRKSNMVGPTADNEAAA